jgi:hypothetical protein
VGQAPAQNFGVQLDKLKCDGTLDREGDSYSTESGPVTKQEAVRLLGGRQSVEGEGDRLIDDSAKPWLTVIGTPDQRRQVLADLDAAPQLAGVKDAIRVKAYSPTDWAVKDAGFVTTGQPTIYVQDAGGKVLHRQDSYHGPGLLAVAIQNTGAIRKADPNYRPANDPNANDAFSGLGPLGPVIVPGALGAVLILLLLREQMGR